MAYFLKKSQTGLSGSESSSKTGEAGLVVVEFEHWWIDNGPGESGWLNMFVSLKTSEKQVVGPHDRKNVSASQYQHAQYI